MLDSITIKNFKAITELKLSGLSNVNYLVGKNGCGKSSVLETLDLIVTIKDSKNGSSIENLKYDKINLAHFNISTQQLNDIENNLKIELNAKITFGEYKFSFIVENKKIDLVEPKDHKIGIYKIDSFNNKKSYGRFNGEKIIINSNNISEFIKRIDLAEINSSIILDEQGLKNNILSGLDLNSPENKDFISSSGYKDMYKGQQYIAKFSFGQNSIFDMCKEIKSLFKQVLIYDESDLIIISIEEPETGLHPEFQKLIPAIFEHFMKDITKNIKFIISTHSPFLIRAAANLDNQKVYLFEGGETVDIYGHKSSEKSKIGYEDGNFILAANKMLGAGLNDLIPTKLIFCESSLAEFIKSFCKQNKITVPSFVTGGGDTNTIDRGQVWKSIYSSLNQYNKDKILDIKMHIIIDDNPQVKDKIQLFEAEHPNELCILKADEQEKLFWDIKKEKFIEFLQLVKLSDWDYKADNQVTFDKFLKLNSQISNKGKLKCDLGEFMGKEFTPDDLKQFSPELHNIIFNQNP